MSDKKIKTRVKLNKTKFDSVTEVEVEGSESAMQLMKIAKGQFNEMKDD